LTSDFERLVACFIVIVIVAVKSVFIGSDHRIMNRG
jgi:hypothetical protein